MVLIERPAVLVVCVLVAFLPALLGASAARQNRAWFARASPARRLFPLVWTASYLLIGISLYFLWLSPADKALLVVLFGANLVLNAAWATLLGERMAALALADLLILWCCTLLIILYAYDLSRAASLLLLPYLALLTFAALLNTLAVRNERPMPLG